MYGYLDPQEEKLKAAINKRGISKNENYQDSISTPQADDMTGFAPAPADAGEISGAQMGAGLQGAAGVVKSSGGSGAMSGAVSGAAAGTAILPGWGTAIGAAVGLVSGMFGDKAKQQAEKRQRIVEAMKAEMQGKIMASRQLQQGTQNATSQILQGSARALS